MRTLRLPLHRLVADRHMSRLPMDQTSPRIGLIHATPVAIQPVVSAFAADWPEAEITNLLDDSLSIDLQRDGRLTEAMTRRFLDLAAYVAGAGAVGILFTCSAFGDAIDAVKSEFAPLPVLKPNEAMFDEAIAAGGRVGMVATFQPSVPSMEKEFAEMVREHGSQATLETICVSEAMDALKAGNTDRHNKLVADAAVKLDGCGLIMLAHFSTSQAIGCVKALLDKPVLTSPSCAVQSLKKQTAA